MINKIGLTKLDPKSVIAKQISNTGNIISNITLSPTRVIERDFSDLILLEGEQTTISSAYTLSNDKVITLPKNCTLKFSGDGMITNGTIVGNNSTIIADKKIFVNVKIEGTWKCAGNAAWFARETNDVVYPTDESNGLQNALDSSFTELIFPPMKYFVGTTLVLRKPKKLVLQGGRTRQPLNWDRNVQNICTLFTNKNINILDIDLDNNSKYNTVEITGGNFDTSMCDNYSASAINVLADKDQQIWGLKINTNIIGKYLSTTGVGINLNAAENQRFVPNTPDYIDPNSFTDDIVNGVVVKTKEAKYKEAVGANFAFLTNVRIDSDISYFGTGIYAKQWGNDKNWLTDLYIDGNIRFCPIAVDTNVDGVISASLQSAKFFDELHNNGTLIKVREGDADIAIGSNIYDICQRDTINGVTKWSNRYAVTVEDGATGHIAAYGRFLAFLLGSGMWNYDFNTWDGNKSLVKGKIYIPIMKESYFEGGSHSEKSNSIVKNYPVNPVYTQLMA